MSTVKETFAKQKWPVVERKRRKPQEKKLLSEEPSREKLQREEPSKEGEDKLSFNLTFYLF